MGSYVTHNPPIFVISYRYLQFYIPWARQGRCREEAYDPEVGKKLWDWLEEHTALDYFNIEYLFAYLCKLEILERWVKLNAEEGEKVFRKLIDSLKGGVEMPDDI